MAGMSRKRHEPNRECYSGLVAARLRELRDKRGWSMQEFLERVRALGVEMSLAMAYEYEKGRGSGAASGCDLPVDLYPVIAAVYGYATPAGWLPTEWPE